MKRAQNPPKRPLTAYMLFANQNRERVKNENQGSLSHVTQLIAEGWKSLSAEEKKGLLFDPHFL